MHFRTQPGGPVTQGRDRRAALLPSGQVTCSRNTSSKETAGLPVTLCCWGQDQPGTLREAPPGARCQERLPEAVGPGCPGSRGGMA